MEPSCNEVAFAVLAFGLVDEPGLHDPVTRLPGVALLIDRVTVSLARARRTHRRLGIFVLCDACPPNDDRAALELAEALCRAVRPDDTVARITERTFVVTCNDVEFDVDALRIARRLSRYVDPDCCIGVSLGIPSDDPGKLLAATARGARRHAATAA
jgi:GGDEF domain-containing protein